jgi:predicted chitinase
VNYGLGTVVRYNANGNFYKVVNTGTNGSDGTDPTISTWYWQQTTCSSTSPTPTPTPTPTSSGGFAHLTEAQFNSWFPNRSSFYTYSGFVGALSYYPAFAKSGNSTVDKREVAAFFANLSHESDYLRAVREYNTANWPHYCDVNWVKVTCASTSVNHQYFGRGPIQISWTSNYRNLSNAMGLGTQLVDNPELLATNSNIAWRSALWYWMTQVGPHSMTPNHAMRNSLGFGHTVRAINGALECDGKQPAKVQSRIDRYNMMTQTLGVTAGSTAGC